MSWLRLEDGIGDHPKLLQLSRAERWTYIELLSYCARHQTDGRVPPNIGESRSHITAKFLTKCVDAGLIDQDENGLTVHDWAHFNPTKDPTNAIRQQRYRNAQRNENRNGHVTPDVTDEITASRAGPQPRSRPVLQREELKSSSLSQPQRYVTDDAAALEVDAGGGDEEARRAAWEARADAGDIRSPGAFVTAGMRSGGWPDPVLETKQINGPVTAPGCEVCGIGGGGHAADCEHAARVEGLKYAINLERQEGGDGER